MSVPLLHPHPLHNVWVYATPLKQVLQSQSGRSLSRALRSYQLKQSLHPTYYPIHTLSSQLSNTRFERSLNHYSIIYHSIKPLQSEREKQSPAVNLVVISSSGHGSLWSNFPRKYSDCKNALHRIGETKSVWRLQTEFQQMSL